MLSSVTARAVILSSDLLSSCRCVCCSSSLSIYVHLISMSQQTTSLRHLNITYVEVQTWRDGLYDYNKIIFMLCEYLYLVNQDHSSIIASLIMLVKYETDKHITYFRKASSNLQEGKPISVFWKRHIYPPCLQTCSISLIIQYFIQLSIHK